MKTALVLGGTGTVGREILRGLAQAGVSSVFTYFSQKERASALSSEYGARAIPLDFASEPERVRAALSSLDADVVIHAAAISRAAPLAEITDADLDRALAVNVRSAFLVSQIVGAKMAARGSGDIVLLGALDRTQSAPLPVHFAATQGALSAMTMALAKELGPRGVRVNMMTFGVLEGGLSANLSPKLVADYTAFSALRRVGTAAEAAKAVLFLALENSYVSGKTIPVNGGI